MRCSEQVRLSLSLGTLAKIFLCNFACGMMNPCRQFCASDRSVFTSTPTREVSLPISMSERLTETANSEFWLEPSIFLASNRGVRSHNLRQIERLVFDNEQELKKAYYERHPR